MELCSSWKGKLQSRVGLRQFKCDAGREQVLGLQGWRGASLEVVPVWVV